MEQDCLEIDTANPKWVRHAYCERTGANLSLRRTWCGERLVQSGLIANVIFYFIKNLAVRKNTVVEGNLLDNPATSLCV